MTATATATLPGKDLLSIDSLQPEQIELIFDVAAKLKAGRDEYTQLLAGKRLAMIFEKDSLRTRFTFDIGMTDMGGTAVFLDHRDARLGSRESIKDMARNLERWVDVIVARTYKQKALDEFASNCSVPVINGLSDNSHPCQALTDYFTLTEKLGTLAGKTLCYVGDGNNTCHSLMIAGTKLGVNVVVCTPEGYEPNAKVLANAAAAAALSGGSVRITDDVDDAVAGAHAIYTDVWASMGQEDEAAGTTAGNLPRRSSVDEIALCAGRARRRVLPALPARSPRRGSLCGRDGWSCIDRLRQRREPSARAEGDPRAAPRRLELEGPPDDEQEESCARLFRRARYLRDHPEMAQGASHGLRGASRSPPIVGQGAEEVEPARGQSCRIGRAPRQCYVEDLREEFVRRLRAWPMPPRATRSTKASYLLGTSIARPLISKRSGRLSPGPRGADFLAHGCTGKGNDQVRFELAAYQRWFAPTSR